SLATSAISITGASGFVGKHLIEQIKEQKGTQITALLHSSSQAALSESNINCFTGDLLDPKSLSRIFVEKSNVVHLAHLPSGIEENLRATENLIESCSKAKIHRLIYCSTAVVVGRADRDLIDESTS